MSVAKRHGISELINTQHQGQHHEWYDESLTDLARVGDYHLAPFSPCLPENNSCAELLGALDPGCIPLSFTGDMNCDSLLDLSDVVMLGNALDGFFELSGTCGEGAGDIDSDGDIDQDDYDLLYDTVAGVGP